MAEENPDNIEAYENLLLQDTDFPEIGANGGEGDTKKITTYTGVHSAGFSDFLLKNELNRAIVDCGFEHPSEVQQECIPQSIVGRDVLCQATSGMGKTAVFILSILH